MTREQAPIEVRMSREVAIWLGAEPADTLKHYRAWMARVDMIMVRDVNTMQLLFWPLVSAPPPQLRAP